MTLKIWFLIAFLSILWGGSFFFVELALEGFTPFTLVFIRAALASLILFAYVKARGLSIPKKWKIWRLFFLLALVGNAIPFTLIVIGQQHITGSIAAILGASTPIFSVIIAHYFTDDEKLTWNRALGVAVGFAGVIIMMLPSLSEGLNLESWGQLAVLASSIVYGFAGAVGKKLTHLPHQVNAACMPLCTAILMLPLMLMFEQPFALHPPAVSWLAIIGSATVSTAVAYLLYFHILNVAGTNVLMVTFLVPVSALLMGYYLLGETVTWDAIYGMLVIFAGLALIDGRITGRMSRRLVKPGEASPFRRKIND
jgi:drug/metabolite transporter (DMT)-like permease